MKKLLNIFLIVLLAFMAGCTDDPFTDLEGTDWQKERNVVSILLEGQIGTAIIQRDSENANIKIYAKLENIADISKVAIKNIDLAYGASSTNVTGTTLDFTDGTASISVVSGSGETLEWEITLNPFKSDLEGSWYIGEIRMYCDMFTWESWGWNKNEKITDYLPELNPELDDVITFTVEGADEKGNPFGNYEHNAGNDGVYGDFTDTGKGWDFNVRFRKIPTGKGTWVRDFERNVVIITSENKLEYELNLELLTETNEVSLKATLPYLNDLFSWTDTDYSYEELAHMSNPMWYTLTKERVVQTGNSIVSFAVENQVSDAGIDEDKKEVHVVIPSEGADLVAIKITDLGFSYGGSADKATGEILDFSGDNKAEITVTSEAGEAVVWTVIIEALPQTSVLDGTWSIGSIEALYDYFSWEDWGKVETIDLVSQLPESAPEKDNRIKFTYEGYDADGNQSGTYSNASGADGVYGEFVRTDAGWDINDRYRQFPKGDGTWVHNLADNKVTITVGDVAVIVDLEIDEANGTVKLIAPLTYESEKFNWTSPDYTYEMLFHLTKSMWYTLNNRVDN